MRRTPWEGDLGARQPRESGWRTQRTHPWLTRTLLGPVLVIAPFSQGVRTIDHDEEADLLGQRANDRAR